MELIHINKIPSTIRDAFSKKLIEIANALVTNPNWLMQVMYTESAATLSPSVRNTKFPFYKNGVLDGYATGLIQFIPSTARGLGTTTWLLEKMTHLQQLDYVYKYFAKSKGKLNSYQDVYLMVFFPVASGHGNEPNYVFETKNLSRSTVAKANPAIDFNKDGMITMAEFKQYLIKHTAKPLQEIVFGNAVQVIKENPASSGGAVIVLLLGLGLLLMNKN